MASDKKPQDIVRSLAAHPRWPDFIRMLEKRAENHVSRLLGEQAGEFAVIRRQGQALEARELLAELHKLALSPENEEQQRKGPAPLG